MESLIKQKFWVILLIIALIIGSVSVVGALDRNSSDNTDPTSDDQQKTSGSFNGLFKNDLNVHSRSQWLYDLMIATDKLPKTKGIEPSAVFKKAKNFGIIAKYDDEDIKKPLDRLFVAQTAVKALGYKHRSIGRITDINMKQSDMSTMAYYGYFIPDSNDMVYPDAPITDSEYDMLISELDRYRQLRGKTILSFGDSIMYGTGNDGRGISNIIAEKYGMTSVDYAVPGASMGERAGRVHIRDQLIAAAFEGENADIILLNGGTNDIYHTDLGKITDGFDVADISESDFSGGFEKTMYTLEENWSGVPVVYIRVHNMDFGADDKERSFGIRGLKIAEKWGAATVDLYSDTAMNAEDPQISDRYTLRGGSGDYSCDTIHPNALGYAKFYLPLISQAVINQFSEV